MGLAASAEWAEDVMQEAGEPVEHERRSETSPRRPLLKEQEKERSRGIVKEVFARAVAVLVLASVGVTVAVHLEGWPPVPTFAPDPPPSKDHVILQRINKVMDTKQDPCKDFYAFVCGNYKSAYGSMLVNLDGEMYKELHDTIDHFKVSLHAQDNPFAAHKAAALHRQCLVGRPARKPKEIRYLKDFLESVGLNSSSYANGPTLDKVLFMFFKYNMNTLLGLSLEDGVLHHSKRILRLSLNEKQVRWFSIRENPTGIAFYENTLDFPKEEIVQIENEAAGRLTQDVLRGLHNISFDTVLGLESLTPTLNETGGRWTTLVEAHTDNLYLRDYPVLVSKAAMQYFDKLYADLGNTKLCLLTAWELLRKLIPFASVKLQSFLTTDTLRVLCREAVLDVMEVPLMSWYLFPVVPSEAVRHSAKIAIQIQLSILKEIQRSRWIDDDTRKMAHYKISNMSIHMGYPKHLASFDAINKVYRKYPWAPDSFLYHWFRAMKKTMWNLLQDATHFRFPVTNTNGAYSVHRNKVRMPASVLRHPLFSMTAPSAVNYGGMGALFGHQMMHAFTKGSIHYNAHGEYGHWWTAHSWAGYDSRLRCLRQMHNVTDAKVFEKTDGTL
ncbi:endothelin-converting enzyme 1-like [Haemaphysalis longicornis]